MFEIGQLVSWTSTSAGSTTEKAGVIEQIVRSGDDVRKYTSELALPGGPRDHQSYLVRVPGKTNKSKGKLYWPRSSALKKAFQ